MDRLNTSDPKTIKWARDGRRTRSVWITGGRGARVFTLGYDPALRWPVRGCIHSPSVGGAWCAQVVESMPRVELARLIRKARAAGYRTIRCEYA